MARIITKKSFFQQVDLIDSHYWNSSAKTRWEYYGVVAKWAKEISPEYVLEAGTNGVRICEGPNCHTIGLCQTEELVHDLCDVPWPIQEKGYDLFIALQTWEHLDRKLVQEAFKEACTIASDVILSFPYRWHCPKDHCHHGIGTDEIEEMTGGLAWRKRLRTNMNTSYKRIIYHWET